MCRQEGVRTQQMINIGVIGCGYWGPNLIRNFSKVRGCQVTAIADQQPERLEAVRHLNPGMKTTTDARELVESDSIDGIVIATPISTHFELTTACLKNRKHIFIYCGAVRKLREIIQSGELGEIYYFDSVRLNLGLFRPDVNVLWDLAPHDFSLLTYLLDKNPIRVSASGISPVRWNGWQQESIAYVAVELEDSALAHFHLNWLSPVKLRRTLIGGSRKMVVYDHLDADNQVKIFDKGIEIRENQDRY